MCFIDATKAFDGVNHEKPFTWWCRLPGPLPSGQRWPSAASDNLLSTRVRLWCEMQPNIRTVRKIRISCLFLLTLPVSKCVISKDVLCFPSSLFLCLFLPPHYGPKVSSDTLKELKLIKQTGEILSLIAAQCRTVELTLVLINLPTIPGISSCVIGDVRYLNRGSFVSWFLYYDPCCFAVNWLIQLKVSYNVQLNTSFWALIAGYIYQFDIIW